MLAAFMERRALMTGMLLRQARKAELRVLYCKRAMQRFSLCLWARHTGMKSFQASKAAQVFFCCILEIAIAHAALQALRSAHQ